MLPLIWAGLGLLILGAIALVGLPALTRGLDQKPTGVEPVPALTTAPTAIAGPTTALPVASKPVPASSPAPVLAAQPTRSVPTPVAARPVSPTPAPEIPGAEGAPGQALLDVRFASGSRQGWLDNPPYAVWRDGAYRLQAFQASHFVAIAAPVEQVPADVVVSATFRKTGGPPGGGYGLIVRDQSPGPLDGVTQNASAYVMEAGDRGDFGIWRREGDHWVDLVPWTHSDSVRTGGSPNDLLVRAIADRLSFSVNGAELAEIQDDTLPAGGVGVFVGGDHNEVALDRFLVQVPD